MGLDSSQYHEEASLGFHRRSARGDRIALVAPAAIALCTSINRASQTSPSGISAKRTDRAVFVYTGSASFAAAGGSDRTADK